MQNTALLVIIIALVLYRWFPIKDDRLLILMESKTDDPRKLNEVHGLISAFKIEHSLDRYWRDVHTQNEQKWNMIMITKNQFTNDHGILLRYLDYLRRLPFIEDISVYPYSSSEGSKHLFNGVLFLQDMISKVFPSMREFHLNPLEEDDIENEAYDTLCSDAKVVNTFNDPVFVIDLVKIDNEEVYQGHKSLLKQIFGAIESRIFASGQPEADYWDEISIIEYRTTDRLCEMLSSKQFQDSLTNSFKGFQDARLYITEQLI